MKYNGKFLCGLSALVLLFACTQTPEQRAKDATVLIITGKTDGTVSNGSGFFVEPDKIVTNIHVVASKRMVFAVGTKKVYNIEKVAGYNPERDLVVLQVSGKGKPLELGEGKKDEPIFAVGYPGGGYDRTEGTVHGIRESDKQLRLVARGFPENRDSVTLSGNSGGPILNSEGKVIGIAVSSGKEGVNLSYAIAASVLDTLLKSDEEENLAAWQKRKPILAYIYYAWADKQVDSKNYAEAIKGFDKADEQYQGYVRVYEGRGSAKSDLGQHWEAIQDYDKAIELIPDYFLLYYNGGNAKREIEDYDGAIEDYTESIKLNPDYAPAYLSRGAAKGRLLNYAEAIEDYNAGIKRKPKDPSDFYNNRGFAKLKSKDHAGAIKDYDKTISLKDDCVAAYLNRGLAKADKPVPDYDGAIKDYNKVIDELNPTDAEMAEAYDRRGNAKKALGQNEDAKQDHAIAYYCWGRSYLNNRNYQAAIEKLDEAIELLNHHDIYYERGNAYRLRGEKGDYQEAIENYNKAIEVHDKVPPSDPIDIYHFIYVRGLASAAVSNYDEAIDDYTESIRKYKELIDQEINKDTETILLLKRDYAEVHYNQGEAYRLRGQKNDYQKAVDDYTPAIKLKEDFADAYHKRGLAKEALGQDDAKLDFALAYGYRAMKAFNGKQYQEAVKNYDSFLELLPDRAGAYSERGRAKTQLGKSKADLGNLEGARQLYQAAIEDHDEAIRLDPKTALYYRNRGWTKFLRAAIRHHNDPNGMIEDYESAIDDFTKARESNSTADIYNRRGLARCMLGYVKANQGNTKEARKQYNLALEDFGEAIKLLKKAIDSASDKKEIKNLKSTLASCYKGLGLANAALGKATAAIEAFEKAKQL